MRRLEGKVALVTGAARGIGRAIAERLAAEGARVVVTDLRDAEGAATASALGASARWRRLDVRVEEDWRAAIDDVRAVEGRLDVLVNNAGITGFEEGFVAHDPGQVELASWRAVFATNVEGALLGCRHALPLLRESGAGSIVNIGSRSGLVGTPGAAAYGASKAALHSLTKSVALHCAQQRWPVRCNAVVPAAVLTPMWEPLLGTGPEREARTRAFTRDVPLARFGRPEEVAALVAYLVADESAYVTGVEMVVDGGLLAGSATPPGQAGE